ncbi:hypothetical protein [Mesorhizobium sp. L-2-11]|uniref:hypothetical protein n=1 Tax=Mesorhizobium sp. L-2-11 TaxID=2744521 RepID=UPI001937E4E6|nr:hypothetical protein [Mesorhizobium sp. L-2-11]BCH20023.1 hypothetical protein MesoLjLa_68740 [Mesorhizobium sp. L-2-11]
MTVEWTPVFVLPNVPLDQAVECEIAAIAPAHDPRVGALTRAHPTFKQFLNRFSDNFGAKSAPPSFRDVASFSESPRLVQTPLLCCHGKVGFRAAVRAS